MSFERGMDPANDPERRVANDAAKVRRVLREHEQLALPFIPAVEPVDWAAERDDVLRRFMEELTRVTGDGSKKRQSGKKPAWYFDENHEAAIFSHLMKWKRGDGADPDSGAHPLVHAAWRCLAIACSETGNHP